MGLLGNNAWHSTLASTAINSTEATLNGTPVRSAILTEPWRIGRVLGIHFNLGTVAATGEGTMHLQGLLRVGGTWENILGSDGVTPYVVTWADDDDNSNYYEEVDLSRIDSETYSAVAVLFTGTTADVAVVLAATFILSDLLARPSGTAEPAWFTNCRNA